jgi:hypothetical protein
MFGAVVPGAPARAPAGPGSRPVPGAGRSREPAGPAAGGPDSSLR